MLVDRSAGAARFDVPAVSLLELDFPTYPADALPKALADIPVEKPGS
jgi:orotate phosphoribosyltransferase